MKTLTTLIMVASFSTVLGLGIATSGEMELPPYKGSDALEAMKKLEGSWEGTHSMGKKEEPAKVEYKVSSNGSTIIETLFPGTKHEMISVYHDKNGSLSMTHYCSVGNQPQMDLVKSEGGTIEFSLSKTSDINVGKEGHMHGLTVTMVDKGHLIHSWTMYQEGKEGGGTTLKLARVQ